MEQQGRSSHQNVLRIRMRAFLIPPIHDGLVLGRKSPIGCEAFRRALGLLVTERFEHIEIPDSEISDILVRESILKRVDRKALIELVRARIVPLMAAEEVMHLDIESETIIEAEVG